MKGNQLGYSGYLRRLTIPPRNAHSPGLTQYIPPFQTGGVLSLSGVGFYTGA